MIWLFVSTNGTQLPVTVINLRQGLYFESRSGGKELLVWWFSDTEMYRKHYFKI